jgi:hypothetical protein
MKPTSLKPGDEVCRAFSEHVYVFVKRIPSERSSSGRPKNIFQCDAFRGLDGPDDQGMVEISDHKVSRIYSRKVNHDAKSGSASPAKTRREKG